MDIGNETAENIVIDNNYTTTYNDNNTTPTKQSRSIQGIPSGKQIQSSNSSFLKEQVSTEEMNTVNKYTKYIVPR